MYRFMAASKVLGEEGVVGPETTTALLAASQDANVLVDQRSNPLDQRTSH